MIAQAWWSVGNPTTDDPDISSPSAQSLSARPPPSRSSRLTCPCDLSAGTVGIGRPLLALGRPFESICIALGTTKREETARGRIDVDVGQLWARLIHAIYRG
jgi:hypothetical protein